MRTINIHEAKTHLSRLVDEAMEGDPFIIAKAGKPKVLVTRLDVPAAPAKRRLGFMKGMYTLPENYWEVDRELDEEIEKMFFGDDEDEE
jgi:prevent-host-death family protein